MKSLLLASMLSTLISGTHTTTPLDKPGTLPEKCPSVLSMSSKGLNYVAPFIPGSAWIGVRENSRYDTKDTWTFLLIASSHAKNGKIALQELTNNISSYQLKSGPQWDNEMGIAYCEYETESGHDFSVTFTPSLYG